MPRFKECARSMDTDMKRSNIFIGEKKKEIKMPINTYVSPFTLKLKQDYICSYYHTHTHPYICECIDIYQELEIVTTKLLTYLAKCLARERCSINGSYYFHVRLSFWSL